MPALSVTAANVLHSSSATVFSGTAGATLTQGQYIYLDSVTSTWKGANCLNANLAMGVALGCASNGQDFMICSKDPNFAPGFTSTTGNIILVGNTVGACQPYEDRTTGWYVQSVGTMISTTRMNFAFTGSNAAI